MPVFSIGDNVRAFNGQEGTITQIVSKLNPSIHKREEVQMITVDIDGKEKDFFYRDLKHINK